MQRRGIPFFYLAKIVVLLTLMLLLSRLFYGYLGGFRHKVKILKSHEKKIANRIIVTGTVLYFLFSWTYFGLTYYSINNTDTYLTKVIYKYALDSDKTLNTVSVEPLYKGPAGQNQRRGDSRLLRRERVRRLPHRQPGRGPQSRIQAVCSQVTQVQDGDRDVPAEASDAVDCLADSGR